ncbi:MAG: hypothetical protein FJ304_20820 [Planctomycetes bacterium]|nr:hypothetical protein [Planctomycetota bacterium]
MSTTSERAVSRAVFRLFRVLYDLHETCRAADAMKGGSLRQDECRRTVCAPLFGGDGTAGLRAELEHALSDCRAAVGGLLAQAVAARHGRLFDSEAHPAASAVKYLMDTAEHTTRALSQIESRRERWPRQSALTRTAWHERHVLSVCESLFGNEAAGHRSPGVLPRDWERLRAELEMECSHLATEVQQPAPKRVVCNPSDRSVHLDGNRIAEALTAQGYQFVEAIASAYPDPISFTAIMKGNRHGKNPTRIYNSLPPVVRRLITSVSGTGYQLTPPVA